MSQFQTLLDPTLHSSEVKDFERALMKRVVGQDRAIRRLARIYQVYKAGLAVTGRPLANLLFLGPTGSGKTRLVEAAGEVLFGSAQAILKIDCAEFQHSHEIAKLIGSPPGYLGHRETQPLITQEALEAHYTDTLKLSFVLFDEIEKASDALWHLLLGILDKATLTLGDNRRVDFSRAIIVLTSNLGSQEIARLMTNNIGFSSGPGATAENLDYRIYKAGSRAASRNFSKEFMNRIDKVIVFRSLRREHLEKILDIELERVQERIVSSAVNSHFVFKCSQSARDFLLQEGTDKEYGARHLGRAVQRHLVIPFSNLLATRQVGSGDLLMVDFDVSTSRLIFLKEENGALVNNGERAAGSNALIPASGAASNECQALALRAGG